MKRILLLLGIITLCFFESNAQSFELTPSDGFLKSSQPDLFLTGSGDVEIRGRRSNGSISSPTAVTNNRVLLNLIGEGYTGTGFSNDQVSIRMATAEAWTASAQGTWIQFSTTTNGTTVMNEKMRLTNDGDLGIGVSVPANKLHVGTGGMTIDHDNSATDVINFKLNNPISAAGIKFNSSVGSLLGGYIHGQTLTQIFRGGSSNAGINIDASNNIGIGTSMPIAKLDVANTSSGDSSPSMRLIHTSANGYNRLSFENLSRTEKFLISANVGSDEPSSFWNVYHSGTGNLLTVRGDGLITHNGFTRLGSSSAPSIKMKKLSGTTPNLVASTISHGLTGSKILGVEILIESNFNGTRYPPNSLSSANHNYTFRVGTSSIFLDDVGSSLRIASYTMLITYED